MGLFDFLGRGKAIERAMLLLDGGDVAAAVATAGADALLARTLRDGEKRRAVLREAARGGPDAARHQRTLAEESLDLEERIAMREAVLQGGSEDEADWRGYAAELLSSGDAAACIEALEPHEDLVQPESWTLLGFALSSLERDHEALPWTTRAVDWYTRQSREMLGGGVNMRSYQDAIRLHDQVVAATRGAEAVTVDALRRGQIDASAGANHTLLAASHMVGTKPLTDVLELESVDATRARAGALLAAGEDDLHAYVLLGVALLREGCPLEAERHFQRALDPGSPDFSARLGIGSARRFVEGSFGERLSRLPEGEVDVGTIPAVVPAWPALTADERRVVAASLLPLRFALPRVADAGGVLRILPIDVRVTDLPELADLAGVRSEDDFRSVDALSGVQARHLACARIEDLLDTTPAGWTLAHEAAHLAMRVLEPADTDALRALYAAATEAQFAFDQYQLSDVHEFFACSYVEYLLDKYGFPLGRPKDVEGNLDKVFAWFAELDARG